MEIGELHNCGGVLREAVVKVDRSYQGRVYVFPSVAGFWCEKCGEEVITPETSARLRDQIIALHKEKP